MSSEEADWMGRVVAWRSEHGPHIARLISQADVAYPPSGSDWWHPELWKGEHWKWLELWLR